MYKKFLRLGLLVLGLWGVGAHQTQATSASTLGQISGINTQDYFGYIITSGDLNGDGFDEMVNNGIEIDGDEVDNDGDGEIDEVNTIAENGRHPGYQSVDPSDPDAVAAAILKVKSTQNGKIRVRYADNSVYVYEVFKGSALNPLRLKKYPASGYYVAMFSTGRKIALVNVLNGRVLDHAQLGEDAFTKHHMQFSDLRDDGVLDLIIASKRDFTVRIVVTAVNLTLKEFKHVTSVVVEEAGAVVNNTTVVGNTIDIRSKTIPLVSILVTKEHLLRVLE